jgi:hypothetical protein
VAIDAFLAANLHSYLADEAQKLRAVLLARGEAYRHAMASDDLTLLRAFLDTYRKGVDADQVRRRLRLINPQRSGQPHKPAIAIPAALGVMLIAALVVWIESKPGPDTQQASAVLATPTRLAAPSATNAPSKMEAKVADVTPPAAAPGPPSRTADTLSPPTAAPVQGPDEVTWLLLKEATDEAALKRFVERYPDSALRQQAEARIAALSAAQAARPVPPGPDEVTWLLLKDTTDEAALKRFTAQYPNSALRRDAEARITALSAAQAARPETSAPEDVVWNLVKDSKDPDQLRRFVDQFPASSRRAEVEQRVATLSAEAPILGAAEPTDRREMARSLQMELKRVGCFDGAVDGDFSNATRTALHNFTKFAAVGMADDNLSAEVLKAVRAIDTRVCPLECGPREVQKSGRCIAEVPALHVPAPRKSESIDRKSALDVAATEPPAHTLHFGQRLLVNDGSCPKGTIKQIIGGDGHSVSRTRSCIPR